MITKIKLPNYRSDEPNPKRAEFESDSRPKTRGHPNLLASIPRKEGETPEEFAERLLAKLADKL